MYDSRGSLLFCFVVLLAVVGCTVQYVSRYDADTEHSITSIQNQVETLLQDIEGAIGAPESDHDYFVDSYKRLHIDSNMLHTRAQAIDFNRITVEQSEALIVWLDNLEELHRTGISNAAMLAIPRQQAQRIFVAMLKFELAKKRQLDTPIIYGSE